MIFDTVSVDYTPRQKVLLLLNRYRHLTVNQFVRLGVRKSKKSMYPLLQQMSISADPSKKPKKDGQKRVHSNKPITYQAFSSIGRNRGPLPNLYSLNKSGGEILQQLLGYGTNEIKTPPRLPSNSVGWHYHHRVGITDFQIELDLWAEEQSITPEFYHTCYDTKGGNRNRDPKDRLHRATKIDLPESDIVDFVIPDAIFQVRTAKGRPYFFALEYHRTGGAKRLFEQIKIHITELLQKGVIRDHYNATVGWRLLVVCETPRDAQNATQAVQQLIDQEPEYSGYERFVGFSVLEFVRKDFNNAWIWADGNRVPLIDPNELEKPEPTENMETWLIDAEAQIHEKETKFDESQIAGAHFTDRVLEVREKLQSNLNAKP